MLRVELVSLEGNDAEAVLQGVIELGDDGKLRGKSADSPTVRYALNRKVLLLLDNGEEELVNPRDDPEKWIRNLHKEIHGNQFWATFAEEIPTPVKGKGYR